MMMTSYPRSSRSNLMARYILLFTLASTMTAPAAAADPADDPVSSSPPASDASVSPWRSYSIYSPTIERFQVTGDASHDSAIAWFGDRWIAQWDGGTEKPGQRIYQSTSTDLATWTDPIGVYSTPEGSSNTAPTDPSQKQWQPGFVHTGDELWSFWVVNSPTEHRLYFSRLRDPGGKWTHRAIFGWEDLGENVLPHTSELTQTLFVGNGGIVASNGRVIVPVTLRETRHKGSDREAQPWYDTAIYSDDQGETWHLSDQHTTLEGVERASWEATIWESVASRGASPRSSAEGGGTTRAASPDATLWMIARNGTGRRIGMDESQAWSVSHDGGTTWQTPKRMLPMELANSRSHVTTYGPRNLLAQHDHWSDTHMHWLQRKDLSLFYSRGEGPNFVAGTLLVEPGTTADYPQIAIHGDTAAVIYTLQRPGTHSMADRSQWVARIHPLPDPDRHYLFPRDAHGHVEHISKDDTNILTFDSDLGSAGIDVDANDPARDTLHVRLRFRLDEPTGAGQAQTLFHLGHPVARIVAEGRAVRLISGDATADLGDADGWTTLDIDSGGGELRARLNEDEWAAVPHDPTFPWPYLGRGLYADAPKGVRGRFSVDVGSVRTRVEFETDKPQPAAERSAALRG